MEFPLQNGGNLKHFLANANLGTKSKLKTHISRNLMANLISDVEKLWAKKLIHANLCSESFYINDKNKLVLGDFEHIQHEQLGTHDMLVLIFYKMLTEREEQMRASAEEEIKETKTEKSDSVETDSEIFSLTIPELKNKIIYSENLCLNLRSFKGIKNDNQKIEKLIKYFLKKKPTNSANAISRNLSFKKIDSVKKTSHNISKKLFINIDSEFQSSKEKEVRKLKYKPPEYAEKGIVSRGVDLWALGCILYEMFYQDILFDLNSSKISAEQLRIYISNFDIEKTERKFQKIPKEAIGLFKNLLKKCPFQRIMHFREECIRKSECFDQTSFQELLSQVSPIEFRYDKEHDIKKKKCFLDSIKYRIAKKFRIRLRKTSRRNRRNSSGQLNVFNEQKFKSQENNKKKGERELSAADGQFKRKTKGENSLEPVKKPKLKIKKPRKRKKKVKKPNIFRTKIEREIHKLKIQILRPNSVAKKKVRKKKKPKTKGKGKSSRKMKISKYFKVENRESHSIKNIQFNKRNRAHSNKFPLCDGYDAFQRQFSNLSKQIYYSEN